MHVAFGEGIRVFLLFNSVDNQNKVNKHFQKKLFYLSHSVPAYGQFVDLMFRNDKMFRKRYL